MRSKSYYETNKVEVDALSQVLEVNTPFACLMHQRNIQSAEEAKHYLNPEKGQLRDFSLLKNSHEAAECLEQHVQANDRIMLYETMMWMVLRRLRYYIKPLP